MDKSGIDLRIINAAHSIDPMSKEHEWVFRAEVIFKDGHREVIYRCDGCPMERWVEE